MPKKDYYEILGVPKDATQDQIRSNYRKKARKYHPDVASGDKEENERKFKELVEAYEVLSDPDKRRKYDSAKKSIRISNRNIDLGTLTTDDVIVSEFIVTLADKDEDDIEEISIDWVRKPSWADMNIVTDAKNVFPIRVQITVDPKDLANGRYVARIIVVVDGVNYLAQVTFVVNIPSYTSRPATAPPPPPTVAAGPAPTPSSPSPNVFTVGVIALLLLCVGLAFGVNSIISAERDDELRWQVAQATRTEQWAQQTRSSEWEKANTPPTATPKPLPTVVPSPTTDPVWQMYPLTYVGSGKVPTESFLYRKCRELGASTLGSREAFYCQGLVFAFELQNNSSDTRLTVSDDMQVFEIPQTNMYRSDKKYTTAGYWLGTESTSVVVNPNSSTVLYAVDVLCGNCSVTDTYSVRIERSTLDNTRLEPVFYEISATNKTSRLISFVSESPSVPTREALPTVNPVTSEVRLKFARSQPLLHNEEMRTRCIDLSTQITGSPSRITCSSVDLYIFELQNNSSSTQLAVRNEMRVYEVPGYGGSVRYELAGFWVEDVSYVYLAPGASTYIYALKPSACDVCTYNDIYPVTVERLQPDGSRLEPVVYEITASLGLVRLISP